MNPVEIDILFKETIQNLTVSPSERIRINLIDRFLEAISEKEKTYQSYVLQLVNELPSLTNPLLYAGIHPRKIQTFIQRLEECGLSIVELEDNELFENRITEYRSLVQQIYQWVGEFDVAEEIGTSLVESKARRIKIIPGEVIVPVVEEFNGVSAGRLRRLKVEILGATKDSHEIKPNFGVVGAEIGNFAKTVESAVAQLAEERRVTNHRFWKASVQFELLHAWHTGSSANLAMAGAFFSEQMIVEEQQELFWINPGACVSGDLDKYGNVLPVNPDSLLQKVEAAFFSWCQIFIIPSAQLTEVTDYFRVLNEEFPNRKLPVVAVSHLSELFYDRRVTQFKKETTIVHTVKKAWRRRKSVGAIAVISILILVISSLIYGPVDRNPVGFKIIGDLVTTLNKNGRSLSEIKIDKYNKVISNLNFPGINTNPINFVDINNDGINEVLLSLVDSELIRDGKLILMDSNLKDTLWFNDLNFEVEYLKHEYANNESYAPYFPILKDVTGDDIPELLVVLKQFQFFKSRLAIFDIRNGEMLSVIDMVGDLYSIEIDDFDHDGIMDVFSCGHFKGFDFSGCFLVDVPNLEGFLPLHERYWDEEKEISKIKLSFMIPHTYLGKIIHKMSTSQPSQSSIIQISNDIKNNQINLIQFEATYDTDVRRVNTYLIIRLNEKFNIKSIGASSEYDLLSKELSFIDRLDGVSVSQYLESFQDSLLWWNGDEWTNKPSLNHRFLEYVGDDSTRYLDYYFK